MVLIMSFLLVSIGGLPEKGGGGEKGTRTQEVKILIYEKKVKLTRCERILLAHGVPFVRLSAVERERKKKKKKKRERRFEEGGFMRKKREESQTHGDNPQPSPLPSLPRKGKEEKKK